MDKAPTIKFEPELHKKYLLGFLDYKIPSILSSMDTNRSVLVYFAISGLDVLGEIRSIPEERRRQIVDWIYLLQVKNEDEDASGFQGSTTMNLRGCSGRNTPYQWCHIANTYSSLATLLVLGDDLGRVYRKEIIASLSSLQLPDGSFKGAKEGAENDMRFVFCAACICHILDDWSGINVDRMIEFILSSISYDGGIGQGPGLESHCGSTFCALASLALSRNLNKLSQIQTAALRRWLVNRLDVGFNGRPNKPADTCYSFWAGGALRILDAYGLVAAPGNENFVLMTQDKYGGFAKWANTVPDPMHTYLGLAGLSLMGFGGLEEVSCELNLSRRAEGRLRGLHDGWAAAR